MFGNPVLFHDVPYVYSTMFTITTYDHNPLKSKQKNLKFHSFTSAHVHLLPYVLDKQTSKDFIQHLYMITNQTDLFEISSKGQVLQLRPTTRRISHNNNTMKNTKKKRTACRRKAKIKEVGKVRGIVKEYIYMRAKWDF